MSFKQVDDLSGVWCEYGEMELRHENYEQALRILRVSDSAVSCVSHSGVFCVSPVDVDVWSPPYG